MVNFTDALTILAFAIVIDLILGEPPLQVHPTVIMGKMIEGVVRIAKGRSPRMQRAYGVGLAVGTVTVCAGVPSLLLWIAQLYGEPVQIIVGALLLKPTFSIRLMHKYTSQVAFSVQQGNWAEARNILRHMVRRDPNLLSESQVISAGVESVAESTVDGITAPIFYYALFGVPGAFAYRAINTLDSMVGYKDPEFIHIGWFSARLDSVANWLPARLTAVLTIISAALIGQSASGALRILLRDRNRTESWNAGWVMSTMAGALGIELEKQRYYVLGDAHEMLAWGHLVKANRIMTLNIILFLLFVTLPTMLGIEKMRWLMYGIECACQ